METYIEATENTLKSEEQYNNKNKCYNNLIKREKAALKELASKNDISATKADRGGAVIIIDVEDYVKEAEHQLSNKDTYKKLQHDPTPTHTRLTHDTITRFKNDKTITENIAKGLKIAYVSVCSMHVQTIQSHLKNIPYSQAFSIKTICSTLTEFKNHCGKIKQKFIEKEYGEKILNMQTDKVQNTNRKDLLRKK